MRAGIQVPSIPLDQETQSVRGPFVRRPVPTHRRSDSGVRLGMTVAKGRFATDSSGPHGRPRSQLGAEVQDVSDNRRSIEP